jgi:hypothetical protein
MSTEATSGQLPEQRSEPMAEAGCEDKIDRNVQGTDLRSGFAEFKQWLIAQKHEASGWFTRLYEESDEEAIALSLLLAFESALDELSSLTAAKDETRREVGD